MANFKFNKRDNCYYNSNKTMTIYHEKRVGYSYGQQIVKAFNWKGQTILLRNCIYFSNTTSKHCSQLLGHDCFSGLKRFDIEIDTLNSVDDLKALTVNSFENLGRDTIELLELLGHDAQELRAMRHIELEQGKKDKAIMRLTAKIKALNYSNNKTIRAAILKHRKLLGRDQYFNISYGPSESLVEKFWPVILEFKDCFGLDTKQKAALEKYSNLEVFEKLGGEK